MNVSPYQSINTNKNLNFTYPTSYPQIPQNQFQNFSMVQNPMYYSQVPQNKNVQNNQKTNINNQSILQNNQHNKTQIMQGGQNQNHHHNAQVPQVHQNMHGQNKVKVNTQVQGNQNTNNKQNNEQIKNSTPVKKGNENQEPQQGNNMPKTNQVNKDNNNQQNIQNKNILTSSLNLSYYQKQVYNGYPQAETSSNNFDIIRAYASNSYNGRLKNYNEDMNKNIVNFEKKTNEGNNYTQKISYFAIFDGHGGDACSKFLKNNFHTILFQNPKFPSNLPDSIIKSFKNAENTFYQQSIKDGKLNDTSGSCALIALIIDNHCYTINLGDSRALYSRNGGTELYQVTRDHKPNDEKEKKRIESAGGKVYYANKRVINGKEITLKEEDFGKGFTFPYRVNPSGLAVSFIFYLFLGSKGFR